MKYCPIKERLNRHLPLLNLLLLPI